MIINKNILHKIIDIVTFNQWENNMKLINKEYHKYFHLVSDSDGHDFCGTSRRNDKFPNYLDLNNRILYYDLSFNGIFHFKIFNNYWSQLKEIDWFSTCTKLPKNYAYSSGKNHLYGYKEK